MSAALIALLLIRLDANLGEWCAVDDLAQHLAVPPAVVQQHLEHAERQPHYGVLLRFDEWGHVIGALIDPEHQLRAAYEAFWFD